MDALDAIKFNLIDGLEHSSMPNYIGTCVKCRKPIGGDHADGMSFMRDGIKTYYHRTCFTCNICQKDIGDGTFFLHEANPVCVSCYDNQICGFCDVCGKSMSNGVIIQAASKKYHPECFKCVNCDTGVRDQYYERNGNVFCENCYYDAYIPLCFKCNKKIAPETDGKLTVVEWQDRQFHQKCFSCDNCGTPFDDLKALTYNKHLYCDNCYSVVNKPAPKEETASQPSTPLGNAPRMPLPAIGNNGTVST